MNNSRKTTSTQRATERRLYMPPLLFRVRLETSRKQLGFQWGDNGTPEGALSHCSYHVHASTTAGTLCDAAP